MTFYKKTKTKKLKIQNKKWKKISRVLNYLWIQLFFMKNGRFKLTGGQIYGYIIIYSNDYKQDLLSCDIYFIFSVTFQILVYAETILNFNPTTTELVSNILRVWQHRNVKLMSLVLKKASRPKVQTEGHGRTVESILTLVDILFSGFSHLGFHIVSYVTLYSYIWNTFSLLWGVAHFSYAFSCVIVFIPFWWDKLEGSLQFFKQFTRSLSPNRSLSPKYPQE